jgi:hypothetical protein
VKVLNEHQKVGLAQKGDAYYTLDKTSNYVLFLSLISLISAGGEFMWVNRAPTEVTDRLFNPGMGQLPHYSPRAAHEFLILALAISAIGLLLKGIAVYQRRHLTD